MASLIRNVRLARRGRQGARHRDHIKDLEPGPVASGASVPRSRRRSCAVPGASPAGRDRHPGVGALVGPAGARGPPAVDPWTKLWRPASRMPPAVTNPSRPIPPSEQPARLDALEAAVRKHTDLVPAVGIVLGSGLGGLADELQEPVAIPFAELPGWPPPTPPGNAGGLRLGRLGGRVVVMLQGRFHLYEGHDPGLVVQPVLLFQ